MCSGLMERSNAGAAGVLRVVPPWGFVVFDATVLCLPGEPSTFTGRRDVDASGQVREVRKPEKSQKVCKPFRAHSFSWGLVIFGLWLSLASFAHCQPLSVIVMFWPQSKLVS
jgi:hypothetical protein